MARIPAAMRVGDVLRMVMADGVTVIRGRECYVPDAEPSEPVGRNRIRLGGQWLTLRRTGAAWVHAALGRLRAWLLAEELGVEERLSLGSLPGPAASPPRLAQENWSLRRLYHTAWALAWAQDVEDQLGRLERGEPAETDEPVHGPHAAALTTPCQALPEAMLWRRGVIPDPALIQDGVVFALEPAGEGSEPEEGDVVLRSAHLRRGARVRTWDDVEGQLRSEASEPGPGDGALRGPYWEIINRWQERVDRAPMDSRGDLRLAEFATPGALFGLVARPRCLMVTLEVSPYIMCDRSGAGYRFDACCLGARIPVPGDPGISVSTPRIVSPAFYDNPFVSTGEPHATVCTSDFFASWKAEKRRSHTLIQRLLDTRHILRAGYYETGHSLSPYQAPSHWPARRVSAWEMRTTRLPVFRFQRG